MVDSTVVGANGNVIFDGTQADSLTVSDGNDTIFAAGSNDTIIAGNGNQALYGLGTDEVLAGSTGEDSLYGGAGADTLIAGIGYTQMQGGSGDDTFVLTQGGSSTLLPGSKPGAEMIYLPQGMSFADFTAYQDGDDLVLQSLSGDTTAVISGFYGSASADKTWLMADGSGVQFLANWVGSQHQAPPATDATYEKTITAARLAYMAKLGATLSNLGTQGGSIEHPDQTTPTQNYHYTFTGVGLQNQSVGNNGRLSINSSENDQKQYAYSPVTYETETWTSPVYSTQTYGGGQYFVPLNNTYNFVNLGGDDNGTPSPIQIYGNTTMNEHLDAAGNPDGYVVTVAPATETVQTGVVTHTITVPVQTTYTTETQGFRVYNVTADDTNNTITAQPGFVGSVALGDGDNYVDLGGAELNGSGIISIIIYGTIPGAFIQAGNGNDTISGTGGEDGIAAGTGFDYLTGWQGTTYYVPMSGDSTDIIYANSAYYAYGPFAQNTLVLPDGVTPQNLQVKVFSDPQGQYVPPGPGSSVDFEPLTLQLRYGDSTVIVSIDTPNQEGAGSPGIGLFKFADGTVLTATQMLAIAGPLQSTDNYNPVVEVAAQVVTVPDGQSVISAANLFTASDSSGSDITWYQISNDASSGGYFSLNGVDEGAGSTFLVSQEQLSGLVYVAGGADTDDTVSVKGWDGIEWGGSSSFDIFDPIASDQTLFTATGPDEQVLGSSSGPDTLIGGYGGDTLVGASAQDTFVYDAGSGAETISESAPVSDSSFNVLQFDAGITPDSMTLSVAADGALVATIGSSGDSITLEGFDPTDPLNSMPIQQFQFADGTSLSFEDLLNQVAAGSGTVTGADGSVTYYDFTPGEDQIYSGATYDANSQAGQSFLINADGTTRYYAYDTEGRTVTTDATFTDGSIAESTYNYNADGSRTQTEVDAPAGGGATTTIVTYYDAGGNVTAQDVTNPDGSTEDDTLDAQGREVTADKTYADGSTSDSTYLFNADGSHVQTEVDGPAGGGATTTIVTYYDAGGNVTAQDVTNPDGSTEDDTLDAQGREVTADKTYADGSTSDSTYRFNADGSYVQTEVDGQAGGGATTTIVSYADANGNVTAQDVTNPNGSTEDDTFDAQGRRVTVDKVNPDGSTADSTYSYNADGSYALTEVDTPAGGGATTTIVSDIDAGGNLTVQNVTNPDGSTDNSTFTYGSDGTSSQSETMTAAGGGTPTTIVTDYDAQSRGRNGM